MEAITGFHAIEEYIKSGNKNCVLYITGSSGRHESLSSTAAAFGISVVRAGRKEIDEIAGTADNRGAVLVARSKRKGKSKKAASLREFVETLDKENSTVLLLDCITDPHNFGAILRSADQLGVDLVIVPGKRSAGESMTVRKTSAGASEYVAVVEENLSRSIEILKKNMFWVYGADMDGKPCWAEKLTGRVAIVMGSEGKGLSRLLSEKCDGKLRIPADGNVDSLNVSVAAGILLYEVERQRAAGKQ